MNAKIIGTGMYAPDRVLKNQYFNESLGEDVDTWLSENVQIYERRWCGPDESTADLSELAARAALEDSGINAEQIDLIILATDTPEFISPSTSSVVQLRLGAVNAGIFDLNAACAGFVTGLETAAKFIRSDSRYKHVLVIGAYAMSKYLDQNDKKTVTLFADGAGAAVLQADSSNYEGYQTGYLIGQGQYNEWMGIYGGGTKHPLTPESVKKGEHYLKFVRKFPPELNPQMWSSIIRKMCEQINVSPLDVSRFFITQININSIFETMDILGIRHEKAHTIMHHYGYTGSACIPMAFDDARKKGLVQHGDLVMFIGSGGGLAFAGSAFRL